MISCVWCYKNIKMYLFHKKKGDPQSNTKGDRVTQADAWDDVNDDVVVNCICKSKKVKKVTFPRLEASGCPMLCWTVILVTLGVAFSAVLTYRIFSAVLTFRIFSAVLTYRSFSASLTYRSFSTVLTHRLLLSSADLQVHCTEGYPFWRGCRVYLLWPVF